MDDDIDETLNQLRRDVALIQDAYDGLSSLELRVPEATPRPAHTNGHTTMEDERTRNSMDPGHDVIIISSNHDETATGAPAITSSTTPVPPVSTASRRMRDADSSLATLRSELLATTQGVRERTHEFDELRRAIIQYTVERRELLAESGRRPSASNPTRDVSSTYRQSEHTPHALSPVSRAVADSPASVAAAPVSRRMLLDSSLRQRAAGESATSLGRRVAARASSNSSTSGSTTSSGSRTITPETFHAAQHRPPVPSVISSRATRLAQEIQQDIARITRQSESLVAWINDYNARLDTSTRASSSNVGSPDTGARSPGLPLLAASHPTTLVGPSARGHGSQRPGRTGELNGNSTTQASSVRPRRISEGAIRARYLRQNVPTSWSATSASAPSPREERAPNWVSSGRGQTRTTAPSSIGSVAPMNAGDEFDTTRTRALQTIARASGIAERRNLDVDLDEEDYTESRNYRVRRRINADGDEEVVRVVMRPRSPSTPTGTDAREEADEAWLQALTRLETMSRQTAARTGASVSRSVWEPAPLLTRGGSQAGSGDGTPGSSSAVPSAVRVHLGRETRPWWPRLNPRGEDTSTEEESTYSADLAAMRARAQSLISGARTNAANGTSLPPPPPTTRPLSFVPTTQGTPGSLWNDSGVRVRLRAAAAQFSEDMRRLGGDREPDSVSPPSPPLERSRRARRAGADVRRDVDNNMARPMWGSPVPFHPSPLPLPLVEDVGSLEARSRVFVGVKKFRRVPRREGIAQAGR